jgi:hypothetical protein
MTIEQVRRALEGGSPQQPRTYRKWTSMRQRCNNPKHPAYPWYGAKGIKVCERWSDYATFLADMGEAPDGYWIDRIDTSRGYEPGNCRWVTPKQSAANRKQRGPTPGSLADRCRQAGMPFILVYQRIRAGWPEDVAMRTPKHTGLLSKILDGTAR